MKIIYIRESLIESILSDTITLGCLGALWYSNHKFCGGSFVIDVFVGFFVLICVVNCGKKRYTPKEAEECLKQLISKESTNEGN
jgi:hypothetical protein